MEFYRSIANAFDEVTAPCISQHGNVLGYVKNKVSEYNMEIFAMEWRKLLSGNLVINISMNRN